MLAFLLWASFEDFDRGPSSGSFLDRTDIEDTVMQMPDYLPVRFLDEKRLVRVNCVTSQQS